MRYSMLVLGLLASAALAAPVPFPSRSANRPLFEAKNAAHAKATLGRFSSDVFHDRVLLALSRSGLEALRGKSQEEQRKWLKARIRPERATDQRIRVVISGTDDGETRAVRDALTAVLTGPLTPRDREMLMATRMNLERDAVRLELLARARVMRR